MVRLRLTGDAQVKRQKCFLLDHSQFTTMLIDFHFSMWFNRIALRRVDPTASLELRSRDGNRNEDPGFDDGSRGEYSNHHSKGCKRRVDASDLGWTLRGKRNCGRNREALNSASNDSRFVEEHYLGVWRIGPENRDN